MKKKSILIISTFLILLMICFSNTITPRECTLKTNHKNFFDKLNLGRFFKTVNCGSVSICADGSSHPFISIIANQNQTVRIKGFAIIRFLINSEITKNTTEDTIKILFSLSIGNRDTGRSFEVYNITLDHYKKDIVIFRILRPGDIFKFEIKVSYYSNDFGIVKKVAGDGNIQKTTEERIKPIFFIKN